MANTNQNNEDKAKDYRVGMAMYELIKIIKKMEIEQRGIGEAGRIQHTTEILLRNALDGIRYNANCKKVNLSAKYPWLKKGTKS